MGEVTRYRVKSEINTTIAIVDVDCSTKFEDIYSLVRRYYGDVSLSVKQVTGGVMQPGLIVPHFFVDSKVPCFYAINQAARDLIAEKDKIPISSYSDAIVIKKKKKLSLGKLLPSIQVSDLVYEKLSSIANETGRDIFEISGKLLTYALRNVIIEDVEGTEENNDRAAN